MTLTHALDDYFTADEAKQVRGAAVMALVTGSRGSTERREYRKAGGKLVSATETTVEAIEVNRHFGPAYRVPTHSNMVIVLAGRPGRYTSHALNPVDQELLDAVAADEYEQDHEPYLPDEDYFRSITHDLDI